MKQVEVEKIIKEIWYEAIDGTTFRDRVECEKYDNTTEAILRQRYQPLVLKTISEWDLFKCGSEECYYDLIIANNVTDVENILKLAIFYNNYLTNESYKNRLTEIEKLCMQAMHEGDIILISKGCDNDSFWISDTWNNRLNHINNEISKAIDQID
jgi:hypothetical protein